MGVLTSQKITTYFERFKTIDVTFTKEIIQVTGLITQQVYLKCVSDFWPCIIYSSSFQGAKLVANIKSGLLEKLQQANNMVSLRFCFRSPETGNPVTFFVSARSVGYAPYGGSHDVAMFTLQFSQRPPDDLIEIMGRVLDANVNSSKRREERILLTVDNQRKLNILSKEEAVFIQGVPRRCILRDLSFSGAKIIMMGLAKFLVDRESTLRIDFDDPRESFLLKGKIIRSEIVEGRKDLVALAMRFDESQIPMGYKIRINDYLGQVRADNRGNDIQEDFASDKKALPPQAFKKAVPVSGKEAAGLPTPENTLQKAEGDGAKNEPTRQ
ncbi:MAG: PilZ domain-containing protein [Treponema sp.]|jgi:hypothetical protein|nr:PilZ domain-containing protein [Treponema sp.]